MFLVFILNFVFHPQENATHQSNGIPAIPRNIPANAFDEKSGTTYRRAAPYCAMC
jgi:hypothetical protein